eukprot:gene16126-18410_t
MELALSVHQSLLHNGGPLSDAVSFSVEDVAKLHAIVKVHLSKGETLSRGKLNSYLKDFQQTRSLPGAKAIGFCFVTFAYHILLASSPHLFPTLQQFLTKYPEYAHFPKQEQFRMHYMCKIMIAALHILDGCNNKTTILEIVARICDGDLAQFVTGGGKVGEAKRVIPVERFFIRESGIMPEKSKKGQGKRRLSEVSETSENRTGEAADGPVAQELPAADAALFESSPPGIYLPDDFYDSMTHTDMVSQPLEALFPLLDGLTPPQTSEEIKQELF